MLWRIPSARLSIIAAPSRIGSTGLSERKSDITIPKFDSASLVVMRIVRAPDR